MLNCKSALSQHGPKTFVGLIILTVAAILAGLTATAAEAAEATTVFYVASNGNDASPGNEAKPFATLARARDAIRQVKAKSGGKVAAPVKVLVRGGKYFLDKTLVFTSDDSGTRESPIAYAAYPGEKPILSGGRRITGWQPYKAKILQCPVPEAKGGKWRFSQLFVDGQRQLRARWPNVGWLKVEGPAEPNSYVAFKYPADSLPRHWAKPTHGDAVTVIDWGYTNITPIQKIDEQQRTITIASGVRNFGRPPWNLPGREKGTDMSTPFGARGYRFYVENLLEELDEPGEWCLDTEEGQIYFWPPHDRIDQHETVAPFLDCLIDLRGASRITISGLTFTETVNGGDNMHRFGYQGYGAMFPMEDRKYCGEAVHLNGAEYCCIERNCFVNVGGNAVYLEGYNFKNKVRGNEISYTGHCGVGLVGKDDFKTVVQHPLCNDITDNHFHHCGILDKVATAVFCGLSDSNLIGHNRIEDMPHHGINLGNHGYGRNIVEYNDICRTCQETHDTAAINCWMENDRVERGEQRVGHVIRYNRIVDTQGVGIYLDNYSSNCFVYGNIIVRAKLRGLHLNSGRNNLVENNIIVSAGNADLGITKTWEENGGVSFWDVSEALWPWMKGHMTGNHFSRNIMYCTGAGGADMLIYHFQMYEDVLNPALGSSDYNLFFNLARGRQVIRIPGVATIDLWKTMGYDEHSLVADPLFVDPAHDDYRLKPESPAFKLGFVPVPVEKIGIRAAVAEKQGRSAGKSP